MGGALCGDSLMDYWLQYSNQLYNKYHRKVTCPECLAEMKKRGWEVEHG